MYECMYVYVYFVCKFYSMDFLNVRTLYICMYEDRYVRCINCMYICMYVCVAIRS